MCRGGDDHAVCTCTFMDATPLRADVLVDPDWDFLVHFRAVARSGDWNEDFEQS